MVLKTTTFKYTSTGQLKETVENDQVQSIEWTEESLEQVGEKFQIKGAHPKLMAGSKTVEIRQDENGLVEEIINEQETGMAVARNGQSQIKSVAYAKKGKSEGGFDFYYDAEGNLIEKRNQGLMKSETYTYQNGLKTSHTDMEGRKSFWEYDEKGNLLKESMGAKDEFFIENTYDAQGIKKKVSRMGIITQYQHDVYGNIISERTGTGQFILKQYVRDAAGNILSQIEGEQVRSKDYRYDVKNRIVAVMEARGETTIAYQETDHLETITDPEGRQTEIRVKDGDTFLGLKDPQGKEWSASYDNEGRVIAKKRPDSTIINFTYDPSGLHIREVSENGINERKHSENKNILYAKNQHINTQFKYNQHAKHIGYDLIRSGKDPIQVRFEVDGTGLIKSLSIDSRKIVDQIFNEDDVPIALKKEDIHFGEDTIYHRDAIGRLTGITSGAFSLMVEYGSNGLASAVTRGNLETKLSYTDFGHVHKETTSRGETLLSELVLSYDTSGNIVSKKVNSDHDTQYKYDPDNQLIEVIQDGVTTQYSYDKVGNRTSVAGSQTNVFHYDESKTYLIACDEWEYEYDQNGYTSTKISKSTGEKHFFEYNSYGQVSQFKKENSNGTELIRVNYVFDALGRRTSKIITRSDDADHPDTIHYIYHKDNILLEYSEDFQYWRKYIYLDHVDGILGFIENEKAYYYLTDHQGSVTHLLDEEGQVLRKYTYNVFGNFTEDSQPDAPPNRFTFNAREWDEESQTYYYRNRNYDPSSGRFLQPDPYPGEHEKPLTIVNKYCFAVNNPIKYIDPYGLFILEAIVAGIAVALFTGIVVGVLAILSAMVAPLLGLMAFSLSAYLLKPFADVGLIGQDVVTGLANKAKGYADELFNKNYKRIFNKAFKSTTRIIFGTVGVIVGTAIGGTLYLGSGIIGLVTTGDWRGPAERAWTFGFNAGMYLGTLPGDYVMNLVDWILDDEINYPYHYELACFGMYCAKLAYVKDLDYLQKRLPLGVQTSEDLFFDNSVIGTQGFIAHHQNFIVVSFRGTEGKFNDIAIDAISILSTNKWYSSGFPYLERVGLGWMTGYSVVRQIVLDKVSALLKANHRPVYFFGHSLGGALTELAALDLAEQLGCEAYCYTCGSPRAGNQSFADLFNSKVHNCQLIQHTPDPVPYVPLASLGFYQVDLEKNVESSESTGNPFAYHSSSLYIQSVYNSVSDRNGFQFLPSQEAIEVVIDPNNNEKDYPEISTLPPLKPLKFT